MQSGRVQTKYRTRIFHNKSNSYSRKPHLKIVPHFLLRGLELRGGRVQLRDRRERALRLHARVPPRRRLACRGALLLDRGHARIERVQRGARVGAELLYELQAGKCVNAKVGPVSEKCKSRSVAS